MLSDPDHPNYSCMGRIAIEMILFITSLVMAVGAFFFSEGSMKPVLSAAFNLSLPFMTYLFTNDDLDFSYYTRVEIVLIWMVLVEIIRQQIQTNYNGKLLYGTTYKVKIFASLEQLGRIVWVGYLVHSYFAAPFGITRTLFGLCICSFAYEVAMCVAFVIAKRSYFMGKNPELIGSHVKRIVHQHNLKPTPLDSCNYIVLEKRTDELQLSEYGYQIAQRRSEKEGPLTIGRVFQLRSAEERRAPTSAHPHWHDICLSFALAKMLRRRFDRLPLEEAGSSKSLDFVLKGLIGSIPTNEDPQEELSRNYQQERHIESIPTETLFRILQQELDFVHELLHTKVLMYQFFQWILRVDQTLVPVITGTLGYIIYASSVLIGRPLDDKHFCSNNSGMLKLFDLLIVLCLCLTIFGFLVGNISLGSRGRWRTIRHVSTYVQNVQNPVERPSTIILKTQSETTGQNLVSRMEDGIIFWTYPKKIICLWKVVRKPKFRMGITTNVQEAVLRSLKKSSGYLTNGESSLRNYGMHERLNWACQPNLSNSETLLVWHIATTLITHRYPLLPSEKGNDPIKEREVASILSSYCHYLVAFLPELLPDHAEWTEKLYKDVKKEILGQKLSIHNRCNLVLNATWGENSIVEKGARLAKELMVLAGHDQVPVWRMLADFWAEMMLFIAPSENVDKHEEVLKDKEFITQIWALLTHAGILTRPLPNPTGDANV